MQEFTIERPNVTYEITVDGSTYELDGKFIFTGEGIDAETLQGEVGSHYLSRTNHTGSQAISTITGLSAALSNLSNADSTLAGQVVAINNTLPLKADLVGGVIPTSQIPAIAITELLKLPDNQFPASELEMLSLRGQQGDFTIRTDLSTQFTIVSGNGSSLPDWLAMPQAASPVSSVNGQTGTVVLDAADVGAATAAQGAKADTALQAADAPAAVRGAALTGLSTVTGTAVTATDSVLSAAGKLQGQASANALAIASIVRPARVLPTWYQSGLWYGAGYPTGYAGVAGTATNGRSVFVPMTALENATFNSIGIFVGTAAAGATLKVGVFECNADGLVGSALFVSAALTAATTGTKSVNCNLSLTTGQTVYLAYIVFGNGVSLTSLNLNSAPAISGSAGVANGYNNCLTLDNQSDLVAGNAVPTHMLVASVRLRAA